MRGLSTAQKIALVLAIVFYVSAGMMHFIKTEAYLRIMPPYIPFHAPLVIVSGVFEILGGMGVDRAYDRRVPCQHLYGHQSDRGGRGFCASRTPVGTGTLAVVSGLVAALVYSLPHDISLRRRCPGVAIIP
jgi:hypothetical protein